jgi:hypothetical protein
MRMRDNRRHTPIKCNMLAGRTRKHGFSQHIHKRTNDRSKASKKCSNLCGLLGIDEQVGHVAVHADQDVAPSKTNNELRFGSERWHSKSAFTTVAFTAARRTATLEAAPRRKGPSDRKSHLLSCSRVFDHSIRSLKASIASFNRLLQTRNE